MLAGNQGADTFWNAGPGDEILGGDGNDTVALWARTAKASEIVLGNGNDFINVHNLGLGSGSDLGNAFDHGFTFGNGTGDATLQTNNGVLSFWNDNSQEHGTNAPPVSITLGDGNDTVYVSGLNPSRLATATTSSRLARTARSRRAMGRTRSLSQAMPRSISATALLRFGRRRRHGQRRRRRRHNRGGRRRDDQRR